MDAVDVRRSLALVAAAQTALRAGNIESAAFLAERVLAYAARADLAAEGAGALAAVSAECLLLGGRPRAAYDTLRPLVRAVESAQVHRRPDELAGPAYMPALFIHARSCIQISEPVEAENTLRLLLDYHYNVQAPAATRLTVDTPSLEELRAAMDTASFKSNTNTNTNTNSNSDSNSNLSSSFCSIKEERLSQLFVQRADRMHISQFPGSSAKRGAEDGSTGHKWDDEVLDSLSYESRMALSEVYHLLGQARQMSGRHREAIFAYRVAIRLNDLNWAAFRAIVELDATVGEDSKSTEEIRSMFTMNSLPESYGKVDATSSERGTANSDEHLAVNEDPVVEVRRSPRKKSVTKDNIDTATNTRRPSSKSSLAESKSQQDTSLHAETRIAYSTLQNLNGLPKFSTAQVDIILKDLRSCVDAQLAFKQHDAAKAIKLYQSVTPTLANSAWTYYQLAKANYDRAHYSEAARLFKVAFAMQPWRIEYLDVYGSCLWHLKDDIQLAYLVKEVTTLYRRSPQTWAILANLYSLRQEHEKAIFSLNRAISLDTNYYYAYTLKGLECLFADKTDEARQCFLAAIRVCPSHYNALYGLGNLAYRTENYKLAKFYFERALYYNKFNPILQCYMGLVIAHEKGIGDAIPFFEKAVQLDANNYVFKFRLSFALASVGRYNEALHHLKELQIATPTEANVYFLQGRILKFQGDASGALICFTKAQQFNKSSSAIASAIESVFEEETKFNDKDISKIF